MKYWKNFQERLDEAADPISREVRRELWHRIRFLKELIHYGYRDFDLRKKEAKLNKLIQFTLESNGV